MKKCTECRELKPFEQFSKMGKWRRGQCKSCQLAYQRTRRSNRDDVWNDAFVNAAWGELSSALGMPVITRKNGTRYGESKAVVGRD